jgi:tape measure domain-containing protein
VAVSNVELIVNATKALNPLKKVQQQTEAVSSKFDGLRSSVGKLQSALAGVGFVLIGKQAISAAATFNDLQLRLKLVTKEFGEYDQAQKIAADAAKTFGLSTRDATEGITDIFARLRPLGVSLSDIESTFIGFNTAAKLSGVSAQESSSAFRQLAQALGAGTLQGDEFRSIQEGMPKIMAAISEITGVATGDLKEYASQGKITSDVVIKALQMIQSEGASAIAQIVEESDIQTFINFQNAVNGLQIAIGQELLPVIQPLVDDVTELIKKFAGLPKPVQDSVIAVMGLTGAIFILTPVVTTVSGLLTALAGPAVLGAAITGLSVMGEKALAAAAGKQVLAASITAANTKITASTVAVGALNLALKAIPFAIVLGGLAAFAGQLAETKRVQKEVNELVRDGTVDQINAALATNQRTLAEIEFQRTVLQATPGALGGFAAGAFDALDAATGRSEALGTAIQILKEQLAEGMIGGGSLPLTQPKGFKPKTSPDDPKKDKTNSIEQERLSFLKQINAEINRINEAELDGLEAGRQIVEQIDAQGAAEIKRGETNLALLQAKIDGRLEEEQLAQKIKAIEESNLNDVQKKKQIAIVKQTAALEKQIQATEKLDQVYRSIGSAVSDGIVNALTAAVEGTKSLADVASQTLRQVANILLQFGVNTALGGIPGLGKFFGGARASGGTVTGGRSYMVGEKGPELFTPGRTGSIAPSGSFGGTNVVVNVDASGSQAQGNQPNAKALGSAIGAAVQAELIKQKRPGGLLA